MNVRLATGLPAVEMPSGRREPNGSLQPSSSRAKRRAAQLNWKDDHLYVTSREGAVFNVLSTQEPGYLVLHSVQTDRWYSLPVELDAQASICTTLLPATCAQWLSAMACVVYGMQENVNVAGSEAWCRIGGRASLSACCRRAPSRLFLRSV